MDDDQNLLRRISSGDKEAMRQLYERYQRPLFAFLRSRGGDAQTADDAVQDAMMDVWRTAGQYAGRASVKTWLYTIGRNKLVDRVRTDTKLRLMDEVPETIDSSPNPEALLISAGDAARVQGCLSKLKPAHLSAIRLAFYDGLTYAEIGEIEDAPEGTIKTRIHYAKRLLFRCLEQR